MVLHIERVKNKEMKKIIYTFFATVIVSCSSTRNLEDIAIYESEQVGEMSSSYIILKSGALKKCDFFVTVMALLELMLLKKILYMFFPNMHILMILFIMWIL